VRWVDPETGAGRTVVTNEDGSKRSFGESTITSLLSASAEEAAKWASALTKDLTSQQLRGLLHELGQRLLQSSQHYTTRLDELKRFKEQLDYKYFGLNGSATEKDLDVAYRRLAKRMHPDKNGGTEEAKVRFQKMKERYEGLKTKLAPSEAERGQEREDTGKEGDRRSRPREGEEEGDEASEAAEAEHESPQASAQASAGYDPADKDSMVKMVSRYAKQLRDMNAKMEVLMNELEKAREYTQQNN